MELKNIYGTMDVVDTAERCLQYHDYRAANWAAALAMVNSAGPKRDFWLAVRDEINKITAATK